MRIAERILSRFLTRVYDGIEVRNAEYLDRLPPACEIVYMPCHRSHMDYLLLSYVIYQRGYAVPYVAAGMNLNLPVIGRLLRKGGAFYIRRSFRGSGLYPIVFMKYVDVMMNRGHPIEFFIEGGRSRTGRLLRPRTGHARHDGAQLSCATRAARSPTCRSISATTSCWKARPTSTS